MATTIYLTNTASSVVYLGAEELVANIGTRGSGVSTGTSDTSTSAITLKRTPGGEVLTWFTPPLQAVTISGTLTLNIWMSENNMSANVDAEIQIKRVEGDGSGEVTIFQTAKGTEVPVTTRAAQNWTGTPTSTAISAGQRLMFKVLCGDAIAQASGFTFDASWGATSAGVDGDTWVQFTETIVEQGGGGPAAPHPRRNPYPQLLAH